MKNHIQTIVNVCFAISITAFIYQNNSLKDDVETLKGYAQLDTNKAWERMDSIEAEQTRIKSRVESNERWIKVSSENFLKQNEHNLKIANVVDNNTDNISIAFKNFDVSEKNIGINSKNINNIEEWIVDNFNE